MIVHLVTERRRGVNDFSQIARLVKHVLISRATQQRLRRRPKKSISDAAKLTNSRESMEEEGRELVISKDGRGPVVRKSEEEALNPASSSCEGGWLKRTQTASLVDIEFSCRTKAS